MSLLKILPLLFIYILVFMLVVLAFKKYKGTSYKKLIMVVSLIALLIISILVISIIFHARSITSISLLTLVSYDMLIFTLALIRMIMLSKSMLHKLLFLFCLIIILSAHILMLFYLRL